MSALARAGAAEEVTALVLQHASALGPLGAALLVELNGQEPPGCAGRAGLRRRGEPSSAALPRLQLLAWQLPAGLGGQVFLELRRRRASEVRPVGARDLFSLAHVSISGAWRGEESRLRLRAGEGPRAEGLGAEGLGAEGLVELVRFTRRGDGSGLAGEVERAVRRIAGRAGASVQTSAGVAIWD